MSSAPRAPTRSATTTAPGHIRAAASTPSITPPPSVASRPSATSRCTSSPPPSQTAGTPVSVTVTARDAYNNTTPQYTGTIAFGSSDTQAVLPPSYTFTGADNGVHVFNVTLKTAGVDSIVATDTNNGSITGS